MELLGSFSGIKREKFILGTIFSLLCLALAVVIVSDPDTAIVLMLIFAAGALIVIQPVTGLLLTLITTSTLFRSLVFPKLVVMGADFTLTDLLIMITTLCVVGKYGIRRSMRACRSSRLTIPHILFFGIIVVSIFFSISTYKEMTFTEVLSRSKIFFYYIIFFPALISLRRDRDIHLLVKGILVFSVIVSLYFIFTAIFGPTYLHYLLRTGVRYQIHSVDVGSLSDTLLYNARLRDIPGTSLVLTTFFIAIGLFVFHRATKGAIWYGFLSALLTIPILLTFTRMTWVTSLFAFCLLWFFVRKRTYRLLKLVFIVLGGFLLVFLALNFIPKYSELIGFTVDRFLSFFEENVEGGTAIWRIIEIKAAMDVLQGNPYMGMGVAGEFVQKAVEYKGQEYVMVHALGVHNSYFYMALKTGLVGLIIFLVIYLLSIGDALKSYRRTDNLFFKGLSVGLLFGLIRTMTDAVAHPQFLLESMIPCLAISFALIAATKQRIQDKLDEGISTGRQVVLSRHPVESVRK